MKIILILTLLMTSFLAQAETFTVHVPGMVCQMCVQGMQKQFGSAVKNPEKDVLVDLDTKVVTVHSIKPMTDEDIKERVNNDGYNAEKITRLTKESDEKTP